MLLNGVFERTLVISPHADDDVIGCGGLLKKVLKNGGEAHVAVVAIGDIEFYHLGRVVTKEERKAEMQKSLDYLGVTSYYTLFDGYEALMDTIPIKNVITALDALIGKIKPSAVLLPYPSFHQDHKVVYNAGFAALRPSPRNNKFLRLIAGYEYPLVTWTNENFGNGNLYIDIADELEDKIEALKCHKSQMREGRHLISPKTIRLWARRRGLEASINYAEMFYILRIVI